MRLVTVKMPEAYVEAIDELVRRGRFTSRSEAIRVAIRELLRRELWIREMDEEEDELSE
ncbi:MAG: ribbon-helix-helix protein, CopG family [Crenarchaeota archaeon]|nr:ribbon-helix-helix protein, CopG family [Thermoproteota archaeon]